MVPSSATHCSSFWRVSQEVREAKIREALNCRRTSKMDPSASELNLAELGICRNSDYFFNTFVALSWVQYLTFPVPS